MRLLFYSCPLLVLLVAADAQLLAPLMSLAGGLASNLNPFHGIASSLTGGVGSGGGSGLRGGLLSSLRGAASNGIGFSALPGSVRNMPLVPAPVAPPPQPLPPFAGFGNFFITEICAQTSTVHFSFLLIFYDCLSLTLIFRPVNLNSLQEQ